MHTSTEQAETELRVAILAFRQVTALWYKMQAAHDHAGSLEDMADAVTNPTSPLNLTEREILLLHELGDRLEPGATVCDMIAALDRTCHDACFEVGKAFMITLAAAARDAGPQNDAGPITPGPGLNGYGF
jgi:hypothetical protein